MKKGRSLLASFFFNDTATTEIYTLSLHDALPISCTTHLPLKSCRLTGLASCEFKVKSGAGLQTAGALPSARTARIPKPNPAKNRTATAIFIAFFMFMVYPLNVYQL